MNAKLRIVDGIIAAALLMLSSGTIAVPGSYVFVEDPRCDPHSITLTHELGEAPAFPIDELISATSIGPISLPLTCTTVGPGELPNDFLVTITNLSPFSWIELFFVADEGILFGNVDGMINGGNAFKIDTTGVNAPLLSGDTAGDGVFSPGEAWTFIVQNWLFAGPPDIMGSIGVGTDSDDTTGISWASIAAICLDCPTTTVPEPGTLSLFALIASLGVLNGLGRAAGASASGSALPTSRSSRGNRRASCLAQERAGSTLA